MYVLLHAIIPALPAYCLIYSLFEWFLAWPILHLHTFFITQNIVNNKMKAFREFKEKQNEEKNTGGTNGLE